MLATVLAMVVPAMGEEGGDAGGDAYGTALVVVGDVNGDGASDVLVGAPGFDRTVPSGCRCRLFALRCLAPLLARLDGATPARMGLVATTFADGGQDLDSDSLPDLAVGAPLGLGGSQMPGFTCIPRPTRWFPCDD